MLREWGGVGVGVLGRGVGGINTIKNEGWTFEGKALQSCRLNKEMVQR